MIFGFDMVRL